MIECQTRSVSRFVIKWSNRGSAGGPTSARRLESGWNTRELFDSPTRVGLLLVYYRRGWPNQRSGGLRKVSWANSDRSVSPVEISHGTKLGTHPCFWQALGIQKGDSLEDETAQASELGMPCGLAVVIFAVVLSISSCAAERNPLEDAAAHAACCTELGGASAGFWLGIWHDLACNLFRVACQIVDRCVRSSQQRRLSTTWGSSSG